MVVGSAKAHDKPTIKSYIYLAGIAHLVAVILAYLLNKPEHYCIIFLLKSFSVTLQISKLICFFNYCIFNKVFVFAYTIYENIDFNITSTCLIINLVTK